LQFSVDSSLVICTFLVLDIYIRIVYFFYKCINMKYEPSCKLDQM